MILKLRNPESKNSLTIPVLDELQAGITQGEADPTCRAIIIEAEGEVFCSGMDLKEIYSLSKQGEEAAVSKWARTYMITLRKIANCTKPVIVKVTGKVLGGGIGLVVASDYAISSPEASFRLPEVLWGLIPAMVAPYLIRRVGYQNAYAMALSTIPISGEKACSYHIVDDCTSDPAIAIDRLMEQISKTPKDANNELKSYFHYLQPVTKEQEDYAIHTIVRLISTPETQERIRKFLENGTVPWSSKTQN